MKNKALEECSSLKEAIKAVKYRLLAIDEDARKQAETMNLYRKSNLSMEEENWNDKLYLVYRNDYYNDTFYIFNDEYDIEEWLANKWNEWGLWDYDNPNIFFEDTLVIWEFHRNICKDKWEILYKRSSPFIDGWSRKRKNASFEAVPSFSIS